MNIQNRLKFILKGILGAAAFSMRYEFPLLDKQETTVFKFVNEMQLLAKNLNGYGVLWAVLSFALAYWFYKTEQISIDEVRKHHPIRVLISLMFGILNTIGLYMFHADALPIGHGPAAIVSACIAVVGWALMFEAALIWTERYAYTSIRSETKWISERHLFICSFLIIIWCWLPWIVTYYPASMDNDVFYQLDSVLGYLPRSNHHPWFSSLVLTDCYWIGKKLGNENAGIFLYIIVRDIILALIYARGITLLYKTGTKRSLVTIALLFYAVTPVWGAYAKHAFKDTFAAGLFCWFIISLCAGVRKERAGTDTIWTWIETGLAATFSSLFRNNIIYTTAPVILLLAVMLIYRKKAVKALVLILCVSLYFGYNYYIFNYQGVKQGSSTEALSIPLQQSARVVAHHLDEISEDELKELDRFWDLDKLAEEYNPILSDPAKNSFHFKDETVGGADYIRLWIRMFPEYPKEYFEAAFAQSHGYYAFTPKRAYWEGNWNSNMVVFDWIGTSFYPYDGLFDLHYLPSMALPRQLLDKWADLWDKIPLLNLTDTIAAYTWSVIALGYLLFRKKKYAELLPVLSCVLMILTCIASPVNDCFRYFAPVAVSFPVLFTLLL